MRSILICVVLGLCADYALGYPACPHCPSCPSAPSYPDFPRAIEVVYAGEGCECASNLPYYVETPKHDEVVVPKYDYGYQLVRPAETADSYRYSFDYQVQVPVHEEKEQKFYDFGYKLERPPTYADSKRYSYDYEVEVPCTCSCKPTFMDLTAHVDKVVLPKPDCRVPPSNAHDELSYKPNIEIVKKRPDIELVPAVTEIEIIKKHPEIELMPMYTEVEVVKKCPEAELASAYVETEVVPKCKTPPPLPLKPKKPKKRIDCATFDDCEYCRYDHHLRCKRNIKTDCSNNEIPDNTLEKTNIVELQDNHTINVTVDVDDIDEECRCRKLGCKTCPYKGDAEISKARMKYYVPENVEYLDDGKTRIVYDYLGHKYLDRDGHLTIIKPKFYTDEDGEENNETDIKTSENDVSVNQNCSVFIPVSNNKTDENSVKANQEINDLEKNLGALLGFLLSDKQSDLAGAIEEVLVGIADLEDLKDMLEEDLRKSKKKTYQARNKPVNKMETIPLARQPFSQDLVYPQPNLANIGHINNPMIIQKEILPSAIDNNMKYYIPINQGSAPVDVIPYVEPIQQIFIPNNFDVKGSNTGGANVEPGSIKNAPADFRQQNSENIDPELRAIKEILEEDLRISGRLDYGGESLLKSSHDIPVVHPSETKPKITHTEQPKTTQVHRPSHPQEDIMKNQAVIPKYQVQTPTNIVKHFEPTNQEVVPPMANTKGSVVETVNADPIKTEEFSKTFKIPDQNFKNVHLEPSIRQDAAKTQFSPINNMDYKMQSNPMIQKNNFYPNPPSQHHLKPIHT